MSYFPAPPEAILAPISTGSARVAVQFENLSKQIFTAEFQKDILLQLLHEKFPRGSSISEINSQSDQSNLKVICEHCAPANDATLLEENTIEKTIQASGDEWISFRTKTPDKKSVAWKIILRSAGARYFVSLQTPVAFAHSLSEGHPKPKMCMLTNGCDAKNSFESFDISMKEIIKIQKGQALHHLPSNVPVNLDDIALEPQVKQSDLVRVVYRSEHSGLKVNTRGKAMGNGILGQNIRIELQAFPRLLDGGSIIASPRVIEGKISGPLEVEYAP